jgi:AraC-like DNA-binding protein
MRMIEQSGGEDELSPDEKFLLNITRIIEENMDDTDLNVNTLSQKSGISSKQLYRRIKALTGMTAVAYIRDQRLKKAASLLTKGSFSISEVMYMVGFSSASYFTRCFCDEYGMPPSEYKG